MDCFQLYSLTSPSLLSPVSPLSALSTHRLFLALPLLVWAGGGPGGSGDKSGNESHLAADLRNVAALNKVSWVSGQRGRDGERCSGVCVQGREKSEAEWLSPPPTAPGAEVP